MSASPIGVQRRRLAPFAGLGRCQTCRWAPENEFATGFHWIEDRGIVEPKVVWSALKRGWGTVAALVLIGAAIAYLVSYLIGPRYATHMQFFVSTTDSASTTDAFQGSQLAQQRVASYTQLLTGADLSERVADEVGWDTTPRQVAGDVDASTVTGTV